MQTFNFTDGILQLLRFESADSRRSRIAGRKAEGNTSVMVHRCPLLLESKNNEVSGECPQC